MSAINMTHASGTTFPGVLESAEFIVCHSKQVLVSGDGVKGAAVRLGGALMREEKQEGAGVDPFEPHGLTQEEVLEWLFLVDTLNFCFWSDETVKFTVTFAGKEWTGYRAMCAALARAVQVISPSLLPPSLPPSLLSVSVTLYIFVCEQTIAIH